MCASDATALLVPIASCSLVQCIDDSRDRAGDAGQYPRYESRPADSDVTILVGRPDRCLWVTSDSTRSMVASAADPLNRRFSLFAARVFVCR